MHGREVLWSLSLMARAGGVSRTLADVRANSDCNLDFAGIKISRRGNNCIPSTRWAPYGSGRLSSSTLEITGLDENDESFFRSSATQHFWIRQANFPRAKLLVAMHCCIRSACTRKLQIEKRNLASFYRPPASADATR